MLNNLAHAEASAIILWQEQPSLLNEQEKLQQIAQWLRRLEGATVVWEVWAYSFSTTEPLLSHQTTIRDIHLESSTLYWSNTNSSQHFSIHCKQLSLDRVLDKLDIVAQSQLSNFQHEQQYRLKFIA